MILLTGAEIIMAFDFRVKTLNEIILQEVSPAVAVKLRSAIDVNGLRVVDLLVHTESDKGDSNFVRTCSKEKNSDAKMRVLEHNVQDGGNS